MFVSTLAQATKRRLVPNFAITVPKLMSPQHVATVASACGVLERLRLARGVLKLELMIETPQSILAADGTCVLRALVAAGDGRVRAAHLRHV